MSGLQEKFHTHLQEKGPRRAETLGGECDSKEEWFLWPEGCKEIKWRKPLTLKRTKKALKDEGVPYAKSIRNVQSIGIDKWINRRRNWISPRMSKLKQGDKTKISNFEA